MCNKSVLWCVLLLTTTIQIRMVIAKFGCDLPGAYSPSCTSTSVRYQCVCDFTCTEWDKPCNWCYTCQNELNNINKSRAKVNKLPIFGLPNQNHTECLNINIQTHRYKNCCNYFCEANVKDICL